MYEYFISFFYNLKMISGRLRPFIIIIIASCYSEMFFEKNCAQELFRDLEQLLIGLDKGKQKVPRFEHFFLLLLLFLTFNNGPFEIP